MSNEATRGEGKKKLPLENLDKVVGGATATRAPQGAKNQQILDALANIDQTKLQAASEAVKAKAPAAEPPDAKIDAPEPVKALSPMDQVAKDVAAEVAKFGGLDETAWKLHDKIGKDLGISRDAALSVGYAMAYKAVFEDDAIARGTSEYQMAQLKARFFATNGGRYDVMDRVISGIAVEATLSGDLSKFASRATDAFSALIDGAFVGHNGMAGFFSRSNAMFENAIKTVEPLPGGKGQITSPFEADAPGSSAELLKTLVKVVECDALAKTKLWPDTVMAGVLTQLRDATVEMFKPGAKVTADMLRLVTEAVNDCEKIVLKGSLSKATLGRDGYRLVEQLVNDVSKNYVAVMVHNPGSAAEQFAKGLFTGLLDDLKWPGAPLGVLDELSKMARLNSANAINDLVQFAKGGMGAALSALENLARTGTKSALPAIETLVKAGTAGALDSLGRLGLANAEGAGELIGRLAKEQVAGAMPLVEKLVRANVTGATGMLENLVKQNVAGAMPLLESLTGLNAPGTLDAVESLARQRNAQALALLETMAREGSFHALTRLQQVGAYGQIEQLAQQGVRGAMDVLSDLAKRNPAEGYAVMERLVRANAPGAMDQLQILVRQRWEGSMESLERLARANVGDAMSIVRGIAHERTPGALEMVERLVKAGTPGSAAVIANLVFSNIEPLANVEAIAKRGSATAYQALDQLAESRFTGALGAMARVTRHEIDEVKDSLKAALEAGMRNNILPDLNRLAAEKAVGLQRSLNLDPAAATALAKAQLYLAGQEAVEGKAYFVRMGVEAMTGSDAAAVIQGLTIQATLYGDQPKYMDLIAKLIASKAAPGDESKWLDTLQTASDKATALVKNFRVTNSIYEFALDPGNEEKQKRMIAEGVLMVVTPSELGNVAKGIMASNFAINNIGLPTMIDMVYGRVAGELFDRAGISDEVRQTARALHNLVGNLEDAFVDQATRTVISPMYDFAKNTGKNVYEVGKALKSGNLTDIGNSMGSLAKGMVTDYVGGVKTYFTETYHSLHYVRDITESLLNDLGATPYAAKALDAVKDGVNQLGNMAQRGSVEAVRELSNLVNTTGKFAEDAAGELLRVADKAVPGPIRDQALRAINEIGRLGGPAREVLYKVAGAFDDGANAVARGVVNVYRASTGWAEDAWNATFGKIF